MKRYCTLEEISDGKLYHTKDLAEVSCNGCMGQASCCHGMGGSVILDPYDIFRITLQMKLTFEQLLADKLELNVVDGIILPNLKMSGPSEACAFLKEDGRCSIHGSRPGICRIFPLGRYYADHGFQYFLQANECRNTSKTKAKISKWIDTPDLEKYERYLVEWHYFLNDCEDMIKKAAQETLIKNINMYLLNSFYVKQYDSDKDFYAQFEDRLRVARMQLGLIA